MQTQPAWDTYSTDVLVQQAKELLRGQIRPTPEAELASALLDRLEDVLLQDARSRCDDYD